MTEEHPSKGELSIPSSEPRIHTFFDTTNGIVHPHELVHPNPPTIPEVGFTIPEEQFRHVKNSIKQTQDSEGLRNRRLYRDSNEYPIGSYEGVLGIQNRKVPDVLRTHQKLSEKDKLSVFVAGCGRGFAAKNIFYLDEADSDESIGIGVHTYDFRYLTQFETRRRLLANIINLKPKQTEIGLKRFEVLFSVFGAIHYHPLNKVPTNSWIRDTEVDKRERMFALLHLINFLETNGLLLTPDGFYAGKEEAGWTLVDKGILSVYEELHRFANTLDAQDNRLTLTGIPMFAFKLIRRPDFKEIRELLGIGPDDIYDMTFDCDPSDY